MDSAVNEKPFINLLIAVGVLLVDIMALFAAAYIDGHLSAADSACPAAVAENAHALIFWVASTFILLCSLLGYLLMRAISRITSSSRDNAMKLRESEERMKLALSGANEGTWDLDVMSGRLNFDNGWGGILGYADDGDRPHFLHDWEKLLSPEDRDRVLGILRAHIDGRLQEYRAEYRIRAHNGSMVWVAGHGKAVSRDAAGRALRIVGVTRDITVSKQIEETIWRMAHFDHLTGLPNRVLLKDRIAQSMRQAQRHERQLAIFYMDLDGFKQVNDTLGHEGGDALLQMVADRLSGLVRSVDTLARMGGDEFILLLNDLQGESDAHALALKIITAMQTPIRVGDMEYVIGCSIGIAVYPADGNDAATLIANADKAMYHAKAAGKNRLTFFRPGPT